MHAEVEITVSKFFIVFGFEGGSLNFPFSASDPGKSKKVRRKKKDKNMLICDDLAIGAPRKHFHPTPIPKLAVP